MPRPRNPGACGDLSARRARQEERLWSAEETAAYLGIPVATLYQWRHRRIGPPSYRVGRWLRYDPADIRYWLDTQKAA